MTVLRRFAFAAVLVVAGCSKEYVRGSSDPSIDSAAMGTGLDKVDIETALKENLNDLRTRPIMQRWQTANPQATVAVFPFQNTTSEHVDSALDSILTETESWLVESGTVKVIDQSRQRQMIEQIEGQQSPVFNQANIPRYGKQIGVKYYVTGKLSGSDERTEDQRRVQYVLTMQVVEAETSALVWQHTSHITKAIR